ncbi:hypothetical protein A7P25_13810 [Achromobacter xylosoxidans]|uniref:hypothetical protein n=1 Tax=Achromobacter ruhlandii TaxID=72557 RepID=UPI00083A8FB5|nr:hypothetical protein [Achromobacter ruhlandii]OCZ77903.1 hypothetical protein A7P25_13810 [Achromobacter xylosoxidans]PJM71172.1 hypothetical protein CV751_05605 [Achromobacter ruhlandii]
MTRLPFAFLAGPFWTAVFLGLQARLFWRDAPGLAGPGEPPDWVLMATLLGLLAGAIAMAVLGLPAHRLLRRRRRTALAPYVLAFTAIGLVGWCAALLIASAFGPADLRLALYMLADTVVSRPAVPLAAAALGALIGASFWAIARPDRTAPLPEPSTPRPGGSA